MPRDKRSRLREIARQVQDLQKSPLYVYREENGYRPVPGEGDPDAHIMFVGEAPGPEEAKSGRPFVGRAGDVLNELLQSVGLDRKDVYITSVLKDRPPGNRDPRADEIRIYKPFLVRQINVIQPDVIVTLGRIALDVILDEFDVPKQGQALSKVHGQPLRAQAEYGEVMVVPLYHPAAVFYNPALKATMRDDFGLLAQPLSARGQGSTRRNGPQTTSG